MQTDIVELARALQYSEMGTAIHGKVFRMHLHEINIRYIRQRRLIMRVAQPDADFG